MVSVLCMAWPVDTVLSPSCILCILEYMMSDTRCRRGRGEPSPGASLERQLHPSCLVQLHGTFQETSYGVLLKTLMLAMLIQKQRVGVRAILDRPTKCNLEFFSLLWRRRNFGRCSLS